MKETISVIVPVYKVEPYLRKCVESILAQTYTNLEIILVDDGSPDACPAICDEYAAKDSRVKVIHKKNGGLSDARNVGLDAAHGSYIAFVDSDDWLLPDMFCNLYKGLFRTKADIAVCNYAQVYPGKKEIVCGVKEEILLSRDEAIVLLLHDQQLQNYVWNKLYAARLWQNVRFPVGQAFEDINTTWKLFDKASHAILIPDVGYCYLMRENSIVGSQSIKNEIDCVRAGMERYRALIGRFPDTASIVQASILHTITKVWGLAWKNRQLIKKSYSKEMKSFSRFARQHLKNYSPAEKLGITGRMTLKMLPHPRLWAYWISDALHRIYLIKHPKK